MQCIVVVQLERMPYSRVRCGKATRRPGQVEVEPRSSGIEVLCIRSLAAARGSSSSLASATRRHSTRHRLERWRLLGRSAPKAAGSDRGGWIVETWEVPRKRTENKRSPRCIALAAVTSIRFSIEIILRTK